MFTRLQRRVRRDAEAESRRGEKVRWRCRYGRPRALIRAKRRRKRQERYARFDARGLPSPLSRSEEAGRRRVRRR